MQSKRLQPARRNWLGWIVAAALAGAGTAIAHAAPGASLPWRSYEAEAMRTDGTVMGPSFDPYQVATEASGLQCVRLMQSGQHLEFVAAEAANALVVRYCLPDAPDGGGTAATLSLLVNGHRLRTLALESRLTWLYGKYPFSNDPRQGKPRHFFDELRVADLTLKAGDVIRLQSERLDVPWCVVDVVDLEQVSPAIGPPPHSRSLRDFGAAGNGRSDDTEALRRAVAAVSALGGTIWVPAGRYRITGDIVVPSHVTIQGAGMWYTNFVGAPGLYAHADRRVRFKLKGTGMVLSDFAITGELAYRDDSEPNDGIVGAGCADAAIRRIWIEHTKVGLWIYNGANLRIEGCRIRDTLADGINLCVGTFGTVVDNCATRGTGDDCFAIWPAASDQGFVGPPERPGHNVFRHCTGQLPFLANGGAIYGGESNRIEDCAFTDITAGCGILISSTFPTDDPAHGVDNNFSGTTVVTRCDLLRCGGYDHDWAWRGAMQICMDRKSISGLQIENVNIIDSLSDGITVVGPGAGHGQGTLSNSWVHACKVQWAAPARPGVHRGLWIRSDAEGTLGWNGNTASVVNDSPRLRLRENQ